MGPDPILENMRPAKAKPRPRTESPEPVLDKGLVAIGKVAKAFGIRGQILVESLTDFPDRFATKRVVRVQGHPRAIVESRQTKGRWVLKLEGIDSLEEALQLRGQLLTIEESDLRPLPQGQYYRFQILGLKVFTPSGEYLGDISEVLDTGSNDVYIVNGAGKERLIPAISDVIREIDLEGRRMVVETMGGSL